MKIKPMHIIVGLLIIGGLLYFNQNKTEGGMLNVQYYDANGNKLANVNGVNNVTYINLVGTITNTGSVDLYPITMRWYVNNRLILDTVASANEPACMNNSGPRIDCAKRSAPNGILPVGQTWSMSSGLINVNDLGAGTYNIMIMAVANNADTVQSTYTLTIAPDVVRGSMTVNLEQR